MIIKNTPNITTHNFYTSFDYKGNYFIVVIILLHHSPPSRVIKSMNEMFSIQITPIIQKLCNSEEE